MNYQIFAGLSLQDQLKHNKLLPTEYIRNAVCTYKGIPIKTVYSKTDNNELNRKRENVYIRQLVFYLACIEMKATSQNTFEKIGGDQDHNTVRHAKKTIEVEMELNQNVREDVEQLTKILNLSQ